MHEVLDFEDLIIMALRLSRLARADLLLAHFPPRPYVCLAEFLGW